MSDSFFSCAPEDKATRPQSTQSASTRRGGEVIFLIPRSSPTPPPPPGGAAMSNPSRPCAAPSDAAAPAAPLERAA
jgi:hypothetical protein